MQYKKYCDLFNGFCFENLMQINATLQKLGLYLVLYYYFKVYN